jgi:hypothetical protein
MELTSEHAGVDLPDPDPSLLATGMALPDDAGSVFTVRLVPGVAGSSGAAGAAAVDSVTG